MDKLDQPGASALQILLAGIFGSLLATWLPVLFSMGSFHLALVLSGLSILTGWLPGVFGAILGDILSSHLGGMRKAWQLVFAFLFGLAAVLFAWYVVHTDIIS